MESNLASMGKKVSLPAELLKDIGDLKYSVTIDKKSSYITAMTIDMSEFTAKIGANFASAKEVPADQKKALTEMFANMQAKSSFTFSQFDSVSKITIPEEAKK